MLTSHETSPFRYKRQLAKRFDRASRSYDTYANFQKIVLDQLLSGIPVGSAKSVLDLGAGTGQGLAPLQNQLEPKSCVALDLSPQMLSVARAQCSSLSSVDYVCADAEALPFTCGAFDLIFSNLAIQWCLSPSELFDEFYRVTCPGGYVVFSTLLEGSMPEIDRAWRGLDDQKHVHQYMTEDSLIKCLNTGRLELVSSHVSHVSMAFESPEEAINSLKKVGASLISSDGNVPLVPTKWKAFMQKYEEQRNELGVPLSYQVAYIVARKPLNCLE